MSSDIVERLREVPTIGHDAGCVIDAAGAIEYLRQRVATLTEERQWLLDDVAKLRGERNALREELAALKAGQGEPEIWVRDAGDGHWEFSEPGFGTPLYTSAPTIPDSSIEHCLTCANRGRVNGASQETFCEQCIFQRTWRKDHYKPAAPKHEETK